MTAKKVYTKTLKIQGGGEIFLGGHNIYPCIGKEVQIEVEDDLVIDKTLQVKLENYIGTI